MEIATSCQSSSLDPAADAESVSSRFGAAKISHSVYPESAPKGSRYQIDYLLSFRAEARNLSRRYAARRSLSEPPPDV